MSQIGKYFNKIKTSRNYLIALLIIFLYSIFLAIFYPQTSAFKFGELVTFRGNYLTFTVLIFCTITVATALKSISIRHFIQKEDLVSLTKNYFLNASLEEIGFSYLLYYSMTATINITFNSPNKTLVEVSSALIIAIIFASLHKWDPKDKLFSYSYFTAAGLLLRIYFLNFGLLGSIILHFTHNMAGTLTDYYFPDKF
jgi:hypothetical protein